MIPTLGPVGQELKNIECIILAGGLGTRLRSEVPDLPKCMAPVAGHPFLYHVIESVRRQGIERFVFSLGYLHEHIETFLQKEYPNLSYKIALEEEPLGTGGAIRLACTLSNSDQVLVLNGDTLFEVETQAMLNFHVQHQADCTLALKPMKDFDRYGVVETSKDGQIIQFKEKQRYDFGLINGGVYLLNKNSFLSLPFAEKFSFEKDYLETYHEALRMMGMIQEGYFIDIGIPEDFKKAQEDLKR